jgi:hypothetical protein
MNNLKILMIGVLAFCNIPQTQAQDILHWHKMSSVKGLSEICTHHIPPTNVSSGFLQLELVHRPSLPDTIKSDVAFYWDDFLNDYYDTIKHQATVFFDSIIAIKTQYYTYYYYSPYNQIENIDSLFVLLPDVIIPPKEDLQIPQPGIVNLVVIDEKGFTKFEVLNINDYDNIQVYLFSAAGKRVYSSISYKNDFDMGALESGTYYYKMMLKTGKSTMTTKGFVQVINTF